MVIWWYMMVQYGKVMKTCETKFIDIHSTYFMKPIHHISPIFFNNNVMGLWRGATGGLMLPVLGIYSTTGKWWTEANRSPWWSWFLGLNHLVPYHLEVFSDFSVPCRAWNCTVTKSGCVTHVVSPDAVEWVVGDPESSSTSTLFGSWDLLPLLRAYWRWLISGIAVDLGVDFQLKWVEYQSETGGISVEYQWKPRAGAFFTLPRLTRGNFLPVLTRTRSTNVQLQKRRKLLKPASPLKFKQYNTFQFRGVLTKLTLFDESFWISIMVFVVHLLMLFYQSFMNFITLGYSDILCWKIFLSSRIFPLRLTICLVHFPAMRRCHSTWQAWTVRQQSSAESSVTHLRECRAARRSELGGCFQAKDYIICCFAAVKKIRHNCLGVFFLEMPKASQFLPDLQLYSQLWWNL